jgi:hypothetical protein
VDEYEREISLRELAKREVVYRVPGADVVQPRHLTYRGISGVELPMALYPPAAELRQSAPTVVVVFGYADPIGRVLNFGPVVSWARLLAASGLAAVLYGAEAPADDIHSVLRQLRRDAGSLNLDAERIGLFATSGSVPVALSALMRDTDIRCAALLYGYTMDLDGGTAVEDMARQSGFVNACVGRTVDDLPATAPMLFVRAGKDTFPSLNDLLDKNVARALVRNLPVAVLNHPTGVHGFDIYDDTVLSLRIIQHVVAYLQLHLGS